MQKTKVLWTILNLIFLILFNVTFCVIGGVEYKASAWISYIFIHFAYSMLLLTQYFIPGNKNFAVFGFPLFAISTVYFIIQFLAGIIFILVSPESYIAALLIQLCIAGLYGVLLISNMIANEHTAEAIEKREHEIFYIKNAAAQLKKLLNIVTDREIKKNIERVYDVFYSSPVKSHPNVAQIEDNIARTINELEEAVMTKNKEKIISLSSSLLAAVSERNMLLKTLH